MIYSDRGTHFVGAEAGRAVGDEFSFGAGSGGFFGLSVLVDVGLRLGVTSAEGQGSITGLASYV